MATGLDQQRHQVGVDREPDCGKDQEAPPVTAMPAASFRGEPPSDRSSFRIRPEDATGRPRMRFRNIPRPP
jgi:hypothetical protein